MVRIRPSKLKQISGCNGSAQLEEWLLENKVIAPEDEEISKVGTTCHVLIAQLIHGFKVTKGKVQYNFDEVMEEWKVLHPEINGYDCWCVVSAYFWFVDFVKLHGIEYDNILIEHHLDGKDLGMDQGGTSDIILVVPYKIVIPIDWKFGYLQQDEADINDQLAGYAVMAGRTFHVKEALVVIYQARMEEPVSQAIYDAEALKEAEDWVRETAALAQAPDAALTYNYGSCYYCDALGRCPEAKEKMVDILDAKAIIAEHNNATLCDLYKAAKLGVRAEANLKPIIKGKLEADPECIPGLGLKAGAKKNVVADPQALCESMLAEGYKFWEVASVKLTPLKKMLPKKHSLLNYIVPDGQNAPSIVVK
jgi:hypothetical protein